MSQSQESLDDTMDSLSQTSLNGNKPRLSVVQEREMHGGAFLLRTVEIIKHGEEDIGIVIRLGNDLDRWDGVFISEIVLGGMVENSGFIKPGDELLYINGIDISDKDVDEITSLLRIPSRLLITLKIKQVGKCSYRTRESRSASSSPRRFQRSERIGDYECQTIPRKSSAQKNREAKGNLSRTSATQEYHAHNNNYSIHNSQPSRGGAGSRSRFRSATASEVLSGGSSSEMSQRDTSISDRDLSPIFGPEARIAPDDDSDSVVFVEDEIDDVKNGTFNDFDGLRNSAPAGSAVMRNFSQHLRPKSTVIPPDKALLEESEKGHEVDPTLRYVSSSDDIRRKTGKCSDRDIPKMTRQTSIPGESPHSPRREDQRLIRRKMAGISLDFSLFKMPPSAKINRPNFINRKGSNPSQSSNKYVPKPSPEKSKSRRISSNKPLDVDAAHFTKYKGDTGTRSRSPSPFSGILTLHLHGGRKMSTKKDPRELYCVVEVDSVHKAQTCTLCGVDEFCWDEKFEIDLEQSHCLSLMIYSYGSSSDCETTKQKLCNRTAITFSNLFTQTRSKEEVHNLALRLDPRGTLYATLSFTERSATLKRVPSLDRRGVFGVHIDVVVRREGVDVNIPFIVQKCVQEVELRGLNCIGIYRVCGSAKKKKKLHDEFEKASALVDLNFENYPDINIITGVLKDYLRELPEPLFTSTVCERLLDLLDNENMSFTTEMVLQAMLLLPLANKETSEYLLDHLKAVDAYSSRNKMNIYNIAVCFGPVLMSRGCAQAIANGNEKNKTEGGNRTQSVDSAEKHIELLHTLLQVWPVRTELAQGPPPDEEESKPAEDPVVIDNQEEDSCYHSNDDLDESTPKDATDNGMTEDEEMKNSVEDAGWDADHLEVSAC